MMLRERFIIAYAVSVIGTAMALSPFGVKQEIYYSLYAVEFLAVYELQGSLNVRLNRSLGYVAIALVLGFLYVVATQIIIGVA
jgi:hypothetical protein